LVTAALVAQPPHDFEKFLTDFGKSYADPVEKAMRKKVFQKRFQRIQSINSGNYTWRATVNQFTDLTDEELIASTRGLDRSMYFAEIPMRESVQYVESTEGNGKIVTEQDWRKRGVITPVKNQGHCGSCWAFASTETLESTWALKTGILQELSEQFVLDCTPNPHSCGGTGGCGGGTAALVYNQLEKYGGIPSEWTYPYISGSAGAAGKCHGLPLKPLTPHSGEPMKSANVTGHVSLKTNSYKAMLDAVTNVGPLTITVDAGGWHDYAGGVFAGGNHTNPTLDHLVQLVGFGTSEDNEAYWLVRNSWGPAWGEDGYIKLKRYPDGKAPCGEDLSPGDGDGCAGGPATVRVCGQSGVLYDGVYPKV